jgi:DNA-binding NarL/FixJ family response regulator
MSSVSAHNPSIAREAEAVAAHTILLIPSDHFYWLGLETVLRRERELRVLDLVSDPTTAVHMAATHQPTFIVVAADLEGVPLLALAGELHTRCPMSKVIVIGPPLQHEEQLQLLEAKIACHVCWDEVSPERVRHILALVRDADVRVASGVIAELLAPPDRRRHPRKSGVVLTERERMVITDLAAGYTRQGIAEREHLSEETVKRTIGALREKFDAPTTFALGMHAALHGFAPRTHDLTHLGQPRDPDGSHAPKS